jgi:hypothetical protein
MTSKAAREKPSARVIFALMDPDSNPDPQHWMRGKRLKYAGFVSTTPVIWDESSANSKRQLPLSFHIDRLNIFIG